MNKLLDARHAVIHTAHVEIKTLTIEGRQVTLSVFRQLPERDIFRWDDDGTVQFDGTPWGRVNYYWGDLNAFLPHVVFQHDDALYRMIVPRSPDKHDASWDVRETTKSSAIWFVCAGILRGTVTREWLNGVTHTRFEREYDKKGKQIGTPTPIEYLDFTRDLVRHRFDLYGSSPWKIPYSVANDDWLGKTQEKVREYVRQAGFESVDAMIARAEDDVKWYARFCATYAERIEEIDALDQLYIAV